MSEQSRLGTPKRQATADPKADDQAYLNYLAAMRPYNRTREQCDAIRVFKDGTPWPPGMVERNGQVAVFEVVDESGTRRFLLHVECASSWADPVSHLLGLERVTGSRLKDGRSIEDYLAAYRRWRKDQTCSLSFTAYWHTKWPGIDLLEQQQPPTVEPGKCKRTRGKPGSEIWRKARRAMLNLLEQEKLPKTITQTQQLLLADGFKRSTVLTAAHKSPTLLTHFKIRPKQSKVETSGAVLAELADRETKKLLNTLTPEQRNQFEADTRKQTPEQQLATLKVLAKNPDAGSVADGNLDDRGKRTDGQKPRHLSQE